MNKDPIIEALADARLNIELRYNTRDTFGYALKSTFCQINGQPKMIFKCPKTDDGTKKSQRGRVTVSEEFVVQDGYEHLEPVPGDILREIWRDGRWLSRNSLATIRMRARGER